MNKNKILLACSLFFILQIGFAADFKILVFHKTNGFRHTAAINQSITMLEQIGANSSTDKWTVDNTQDASVFTTQNLSQYDIIVFSSTSGGNLLNSSQKAAMEAFIRSGKGFIGFHAATDTYRNTNANTRWLWYNQLVGGIVQTSPYHTPNGTQAVMKVLTNHPITSPIGNVNATWLHSEEWYYWERNGGQLSSDNTVLLEVQSTGNNSYDAKRPITWCKEFDGGRSFYTALGHNGTTYASNQTFRDMVEQAVLWVSNRTPGAEDCDSPLTSNWRDLLADDFDCWEKWLGVPHTSTGLPGSSNNVNNGSGTPLGLNNDPANVFNVITVNGEKQLYITGEVYGGLTTLEEYSNYHLSMQFKWGTKKWEPRLNQKRDSGILYHCKGNHGAFWDTWKSSLEFQVQEADCGDYIGLANVGGLVQASQNGGWVFDPINGTLQSQNYVSASQNFENPNGQWNTLEVIVIGDRAIHYVNGNMVNAVEFAKYNGNTVTNGQIQIQSEAAEIYYRDMKIKAANDFPESDKIILGWSGGNPITVCDTNAPIGSTIALQKSNGDQNWVTINATNNYLIADADLAANRALFILEAHPNGCVALKSVANGKYVQVNGSSTTGAVRATGNAPGTWEKFGWKEKGNGQVALKSLFNNGWVQANWTEDNTTLSSNGSQDGNWETFNMVIISTCLGTPQGTACNDGDACTSNDVYDANCTCIGTPIVPCGAGPVCDTNAPIGDTIALQKLGGDQNWVTINATNTNLTADADLAANRDLFIVEAHPDGCISLRSVANGKYVQVYGGIKTAAIRAIGNAPGTWEKFGWKDKGNGQVSLKSLLNDGWVRADWAVNNTILNSNGTQDGNSETFNYVVINREDPEPDVCDTNAPIGETISLQKLGGDQNWITINPTSTDLIADADLNVNRDLFIVEAHPDGCIALKSVSNGKYVQVNGGITTGPLKARGLAPGTWEKFGWKDKGNGQVSLESLFNDGWVQATWTTDNATLTSSGTFDGNWETFNYQISGACPASINETASEAITTSQSAGQYIETNGRVLSGSVIDYSAGDYLSFLSGFEIELGGIFHGFIEECE